jgi:hypothetical protein
MNKSYQVYILQNPARRFYIGLAGGQDPAKGSFGVDDFGLRRQSGSGGDAFRADGKYS